MKRKALGRGLQALIPDAPVSQHAHDAAAATAAAEQRSDIVWLDPATIQRNPRQPREQFDAQRISDLAASIRSNGIMQPIVVRRQGQGFELIAGERRLRAVRQLGHTEIPAVVREAATEQQSLELSLLENIQRENLNPVEEATAYQHLVNDFHLTHEAIATAVGKNRSTIANAVRLLRLPPRIVEALRAGAITMGHARTLLSVERPSEQQRLFEEFIVGKTSVRQAEARTAHTRRRRGMLRGAGHTPELRALEEELGHALGTKVRIAHAQHRGKIVVEYYSHDDLERIRQVIAQTPAAV